MHIAPDFDYGGAGSNPKVQFLHRKLPDGDIYFIDNRSDDASSIDASFRVTGFAPELWRAETGKATPTSYSMTDSRTTVPLHLEPWGTVFVVFRKPTTQRSLALPQESVTQLATLDGPWTLSFQPGRGAPASVKLNQLASWSNSGDTGVKYFSGSGTYTQTVQAPQAWFHHGASLWLDLGDVKNLADVTVNGKDLGILWHAPFRVDVSGALKPGANEIAIKVTNAWVNRLIGDQQPDATVKYTFTDFRPYRADSPLMQSGLLGPVRITSASTQP
jgi:hypothetical protein